MPRKGPVAKRDVLPDPLYNSKLVTRLINQTEPEPWAVQFDDWLMDQLEKQDFISLFQYEKLAPNAKLAVPRPEHFVPLLIAAGSGSGQPKVIYRSYEFGSLSYLCIQF